jgi:hypothetical protein
MSIETLNTAVHAAGFAMAPSDEPVSDLKSENSATEAWRPGEAILPDPELLGGNAPPSITDRLKGILGLL